MSKIPLYTDYGTKTRTEINPPEGFQSIRLKYSWASPLAKDIADSTTWPSSELYAIRPITPDDPPAMNKYRLFGFFTLQEDNKNAYMNNHAKDKKIDC